MKFTPAYSTYMQGNKQVSHRCLGHSCRSYLEDDVSGTLLRERLVGLFDDIDVSGLRVRDSFYSFWELGHGCVEDRPKDLDSRFIYENDNKTQDTSPISRGVSHWG